jgi:hypothetical protein
LVLADIDGSMLVLNVGQSGAQSPDRPPAAPALTVLSFRVLPED